ncbi:pentatricopeptide repeat-containing protein At1g11290, chloroplastic-like [Cucurbita maxima]|uniref:Pentatricopeptide repeat-containing protein At1g11290, chloroplastic-like n=1 Tax=Cucurbita maxima TaxID=3661 RepID=A0A6J1K3Q8_CUCMA|nr:pentatricopeptide repeat-containing protein At1g11290, chloroplastic-like [Cucurbita maxima]
MFHLQRSKSITQSPIFRFKFPNFPATQSRLLNTLSSLFSRCKSRQQLEQIHARFVLHGFHQNPTLSCKLIDCYANFGLLNVSHHVFNSIIDPNSTLYNAILRNLTRFGEYERTLLVYREMVAKSMHPDEQTYPFVLQSCCCLSNVEFGKNIHGCLIKLGVDSYDTVVTVLAEMYGKCIDFENAHQLFDKMSVKDLDCWSSLISEAPQNGNGDEISLLLGRMKSEPLVTDSLTFINLLRSISGLSSIQLAKIVHCIAIVSNLCGDLLVDTAVLSLYSKLGSLVDARKLFEKMPEKDRVVWNIMIAAYAREGRPMECLELFESMARSGIRADLFTALPVISSISQLKCADWGKQTHANILRNGSDSQVSVHNSLIDMYCECNSLESACKIFNSVTNKTVISWSAMIKGNVKHGYPLIALSLFFMMKSDGIQADFITVINIMPAFVDIGALENVKYLHGYSLKLALTSLPSLNTALLITYAKCGCIEMAQRLFEEERVNDKDLIMWNSMISAHANHGDWSQCFKLYNQMKCSNSNPDQVTFLGLLTACVNSGLVEKGKEFFKEMIESYSCQPSQEHYACMVNLLGRAGLINEAGELVRNMPIKPDARVWGPLLSACKLHPGSKLAEFAAEKLIDMEPKNAGNYILLSNIYAAAGKWDGVAKMRSFLRDKGLKKTPGCSWLEINGRVAEFRVADRTHPRAEDIYAILGNLELDIKEAKEMSPEKLGTLL